MSYLGKLIDAEVSNRIQAWAKKIKLTRSDPQFARFRVDVANALHTCIVLHIAEQDLRQLEKPVQGLARSVRVLKNLLALPTCGGA